MFNVKKSALAPAATSRKPIGGPATEKVAAYKRKGSVHIIHCIERADTPRQSNVKGREPTTNSGDPSRRQIRRVYSAKLLRALLGCSTLLPKLPATTQRSNITHLPMSTRKSVS